MKCTVLIVEDDVDVAEALSLVVESIGHRAEIAVNGAQALQRLRSRPRPRLIMLDLMMPVMDGFEFRRAQMQVPELADIPVVVLSADAHAARKAEDVGGADYLVKPVDLSRLVEIVRRYCG